MEEAWKEVYEEGERSDIARLNGLGPSPKGLPPCHDRATDCWESVGLRSSALIKTWCPEGFAARRTGRGRTARPTFVGLIPTGAC